jgi:hypothetical protein
VALAQTPVMDLRIGEAPRGFDTAGGARPYVAADGTAASAVVDILRVQLLTGGPGEVLDVRIGHMEAAVTVPAGGVRCPVPVSNEPVDPGGSSPSPSPSPSPIGATLSTGWPATWPSSRPSTWSGHK